MEFIGFFSVLLFFLSSCQAKAQCKVLPVGKGNASEFRVKASEKGVRIIYLDLKFRNDSYRPLESENEFLPNRWVWASLISEPMLSLSYDYDILSLGLLKYQTRSMEMLLEDQPSGCLANFNSSCQNKVVGRALLNMTQLNSGEPPDRNVVCVAIIEDYVKDFLWSFFDGNVKFRCCEMSEQETEESAYIQCELEVQVSGWFKAFNGTLNLLTVLMMLYCPAFLLFLPDSIFNLQEECEKEERRAIEEQSEDSHHRQGSLQRSRYGSTDEALVNVNAENSDSVPLVTLAIPTQSQQAYSQSLLYLDEPNPITFSYFLRNYTKERTELFSFHSKFAFLWYCVIPIFVYLILGLNYIVEGKFMVEVHKRPKAYLLGPLFSYLFDFQGLFSWLMALAPLILILFSSPKDFLITVRGDIRQVVCPVCKENTVSVGEDMLRHLGKLAVNSYKLASCLITLHQKALVGSIKFFTRYGIEKRDRTPFIALWVLFWDFVSVIVVGGIFGGICLCLLLVGLVLLIFWYSPWFSLIQVCFRKLLQIARKRIHEISNENLLFHTHILKLFVVEFFVFCFHLLVEAILTDGCWVGGLSCRCITRMFGLVILGLVLNASIVGPFVALSIVALTNIYHCYFNLHMRVADS